MSIPFILLMQTLHVKVFLITAKINLDKNHVGLISLNSNDNENLIKKKLRILQTLESSVFAALQGYYKIARTLKAK